jgi:excisionase family DNA binding protein
VSRAPTLAPQLVSAPESTLAPRLVDYETAAKYLGIPIGTLRSMVCRRQIPHVRLSARVVRFELAALDSVIEERRVGAGGAP